MAIKLLSIIVSFKPLTTSNRCDTKFLKIVSLLLDDLWKYIFIHFMYNMVIA